ncbi:esterase/lipase family protein [Aliikangiella coralliicola]|uniref:Alpha/beta hydrolase n=1 Tax=Aliikangiella coralliicola TaxID=2592383 RepID=A0A545U7C5_9GAMM|nr:alpha/beta hydrolase [Aliikangiella coralliicola]TQV85378.1 alpha/beta hydrolase [Aliikangiella coralliicola]
MPELPVDSACNDTSEVSNQDTAVTHQVVLLHGLGRSPRSMKKLQHTLENDGYLVRNLGYNSLLDSYQEILEALDNKISEWVNPHWPIHFVGHSFGGILIRGLLARHPEWNKGRCVMLGSPNKGTKTASFMLSHWWFRHFVPKVTSDLTPGSELLNSLPEPEIETGIIAGNVNYSIVIPVSWYYKRATGNEPGDGVVELSNTQCSNMADFIIMPLHHSFMTWDSELLKQVIHFIENGHFTDEYQPVTQ